MRRFHLISTLLVAGFVVVGLAGVATAAKDQKLDGRALYKEYCKPCHTADSANGEFTPMTLIQDQWEEFFEEDYVASHKDVADPHHGGAKVLEEITPEMLKLMKKFAVDHAADSEHPMTCG